MFNIAAISAFEDNYIWAMHNEAHAVVVDPGDAEPVLSFLASHGLELTAILCTHRHHDHIGGIAKLCSVYNLPVYGRQHSKNPQISHDLKEGDQLKLDEFGLVFDIMEVPGHVDDHIAYYSANPGILFCGDVLFGAGCGKNFEGPVEQLHRSLQRFSRLPENTLAYCAHEYTASNLGFAKVCDPDNPGVQERIEETQALREKNLSTVPFTISRELATNPFMRCNDPAVLRSLQKQGYEVHDELSAFTALRDWRDRF
jgi:hydroxyacylglutathione hydrolase